MAEKIRVGFIGFGLRGYLMTHFQYLEGADLVAVCDLNPEKLARMKKFVYDKIGKEPYASTDYHDLINNARLDAVIICTSWSSHIPLSIDFMEAGIAVGCEVGGCDNLNEIWQLVRTHRRTGTHFMILENCCYGRKELMLLNMVKQGLFGEISFCTGGYHHFLCDEILEGRNYRLKNYIHRNCDNYPTHALGPIAKILDINHGNRFVSLTSMSSKSVGLKAHIERMGDDASHLSGTEFNQGDVISTNIKCANGEVVSLSLATTTPVIGSRCFTISGTKAFYDSDTKSLAMYTDKEKFEDGWQSEWDNQEKYMEKYDHPIWKKYLSEGVRGGHNGMDYLVLSAFIESVRNGTKPPIDVYDAAAWMAVTPLSESSIALGGTPVDFPDFTYGQWLEEDTPVQGEYSLYVPRK